MIGDWSSSTTMTMKAVQDSRGAIDLMRGETCLSGCAFSFMLGVENE